MTQKSAFLFKVVSFRIFRSRCEWAFVAAIFGAFMPLGDVTIVCAGPAEAFPAALVSRSDTSDAVTCSAAIQASAPAFAIPPKLLDAIGLVESGRINPRNGRTASWPWTVNVAGAGYFFPSKAQAIAAVQIARAAGVSSIDVGCMQVNLMYHPDAFVNLDQAFDPRANAQYAAAFLNRLHLQTGSWSSATAAYHSMTPERGADYFKRVVAIWQFPDRFSMSTVQRTTAKPVPEIDPKGVMTPEFRARVVRAAEERLARSARMGLTRFQSSPRLALTLP